MKYNPISVITGVLLLFLFSYLFITIFTFIYLKLIKKNQKNKCPKIFLSTFLVTLAWMISTFIATVFASSSGMVMFASLSLIFIFISIYFFSNRAFEFSKKEKIYYSFLVCLIFNPVWLAVIGIL